MDIQKITQQLNSEFTSDKRKLVFWYDENKEFIDEINNLIFDNAKILVINGNDYFKTKYLLEVIDKKSNYLIYAPFSKPEDINNPLLDTLLYSKQFFADYYSLLADELNIPLEYKNHLEKYASFFASKARTKAFKELNVDYKNTTQIDLSIMAVLCKVKVADFVEMFKSVVSHGLEDNTCLQNMEKLGSIAFFWDGVQRYFGYQEENPTLEKLLVSIFVTNVYHVCQRDLPNNLNQYILPKISECSVFLSNYKNNALYTNSFNDLSQKIGQLIQIRNVVSRLSFSDIKNNDVFTEFDQAYIKHLITYAQNQVNLELIDTYLLSRENTHFYKQYEHEYEALKNAFYLIKEINRFEQLCHSVTVQDYAEKYAVIDKYYDLYVYHYNKTNSDIFTNLNELIENKYNNVYLDKLNMYWDQAIADYGSYDAVPVLKQQKFYTEVVRNIAMGSRINGEPIKVCVIVSDALRYEAAMQLNDFFTSHEKYQTKLYPMLSTIPSYTQLGMAALLPNHGVEVNRDYTVTIKGKNTQGLSNRDLILNQVGGKAIQYEEIKNKSKEELREWLLNYRLIYVYHNQIDARGDHALSENEVFDAVHESVSEIDYIIRKMRADLNFVNFVITSDHGFIYRRKKLAESDKIDIVNKTNKYINKRFIYSTEKINQPGVLEFNSEYLDANNKLYTYVPRGGNIFKVQGAGQNYVHGGSSLQEIVVPVIELKTTQRQVETTYVNVDLIASKMKVTSLMEQFHFIQIDKVTDMVKERKYRIYFIDENNNIISNECLINANVITDDMNLRTFVCKFDFMNQQYDSRKKYYMIISTENGIEYKRYEFIFDIAFANNFSFDF